MNQTEIELDLFIDQALSYTLSNEYQRQTLDVSLEINLSPSNSSYEALILKATILNLQNKHVESKLVIDNTFKLIDSIIKLNPNNYVAHMYYGLVIELYDLFEYECDHDNLPSILDCCGESLDIIYQILNDSEDKDADALFYAGQNHVYIGMFSQAKKFFDSCIDIDPHYYKAWLNKGVILSMNIFTPSDLIEVLNCYDKANEIFPDKLEPKIRREIVIETFEESPFSQMAKFR